MMMMADGLLGPCSDQVIEGVTVKMDSDAETEEDSGLIPNGYPSMTTGHHNPPQNHHPPDAHQEVVDVTVPHLFSSLSAACANCSISFFDPIGNPVYQPIFYMCLDSNTNEAIQISSVIHIIFAKKLSRCSKPSADLALCSKCAELVARMYQIYRELDGISAVNAYINSFLGDINNDVYLPTPESSNTSINYAHYEDAISAVISGDSSLSILPDVPTISGEQLRFGASTSSSSSSASVSQRLLKTEPPPLTYPSSYFAPPRPNPFAAQYSSNEQFIIPEMYPPQNPEVQMQIPNTSYAPNLATHSQQQEQLQSEPPPPKTAKKRKKKAGDLAQSEMGGQRAASTPIPSPVTTPVRPRNERIINCPEAGCPKVYHGRGATASLRQHIQIVHLKQFPFVCQVCLRPMKKRSLLEAHLKTHLGAEEMAAVEAGTPVPAPAAPLDLLPKNSCPDCRKIFATPCKSIL